MEVPVMNMAGEQVDQVELSPIIFEAKINRGLMHQALVRQLANARQGTHKAKTRGEVNRTTAKWYRQKGTGRARHGSRRAPIFVGGGVAHGPKPRDYSKEMPRKMRRAALRSALTIKAQTGNLVVVDKLQVSAPRTKEMSAALTRLAGDNSVLLLLPASGDSNVALSARNLRDVKLLSDAYLNVRDLLGYEKVVLSLDSLEAIQTFLGQEDAYTYAMDEEE
ncbi:MAG: 50S ribosomal protein L4 [Candidatus Promineifilaceae bacterium]